MNEKRFYANYVAADAKVGNGLVDDTTGVITARRVLNKLHAQLGDEGFNEARIQNQKIVLPIIYFL